ncbi:MAG: tyrosine-type recombinase/integrase [Treponema sp.]
MEEVFEQYLEYGAGIKNFSPKTVEAYRADMLLFSAWLEDNACTFEQVSPALMRIFSAELRDKHFAPASVNRVLSSVRGFYRYAVKHKLCKENPASVIRNIRQPQKLPLFLFPEEAEEFCKMPEHSAVLWYTRDAALFSLLYSTGCRVSELLSLTLADVEHGATAAIISGKGRKERKVFFADFAQAAVQNYLPERMQLLDTVHHTDCKALFLNKNGGSLTANGVRYIIRRYTALIPHSKKLTPHAFRHSFASMFVTRGADIRVVQELLGHSSIAATQRYTHITAAQLHDIYRAAHPHG